MFKKRGNKSDTPRRNPQLDNPRQSAYHYSSRRSEDYRNIGRHADDDSQVAKRLVKDKFWTPGNLPAIFAILLIAGGVFYMLTLSTSPSITITNRSEKTEAVAQNILKPRIQEFLNGNILHRFKPTFNEPKISEQLQELIPEASDIRVQVNLLKHSPEVIVTLPEPSLLLTDGNQQFVIGSDGKILADLSSVHGNIDVSGLPIVQDETGVKLEVGKSGLTNQQVAYITEVIRQLSDKHIDISSLIITGGGAELDVRLAGYNYVVKFNFFEDARQSSGVLLSTKNFLDSEGTVPSEYIDVRVSERAYVR